jgi:Branched-chain amino acid transport system / permease component/SnoaL-like domain
LLILAQWFQARTADGRGNTRKTEAIATGINVHRVSAVAFGIGLGLAAAAGVFAPFMLGSITPAMGAEVTVTSFAVIVIGSLGNPLGTVLGGMVMQSYYSSWANLLIAGMRKDPSPSMELHSREALAPVFADLNKYQATMHFVGQSTISSLDENHATGRAYCLAHHLTVDGGHRRLMIATLRYHDTFAKVDGGWLFAERRLYVDWIEERTL